MRNVYTHLCFPTIALLAVFAAGCEEVPPDPVNFVAANPPSGSTIAADASITVTFDRYPGNVAVNPGRVSVSGQSAIIRGPFNVGALSVALTWLGGGQALNYTVTAAEGGPDSSGTTGTAPEGMVAIPAGEFEMGSADADAQNDEQPVHTVSVDAFYMDKYEVTNLDFKRFVLANPRWSKDRIDGKFHSGTYLGHWNGNNYPSGKANHPVVYVSWYAAMAYAQWAEKRLPTEAEWEYAARGGLKGKKYPWGNVIDPGKANYGHNVSDTTPVGKYPANGYKLYDMAGNVWEWCLDEYDSDFYFRSPRRNPLSGANSVEWIMNNFTGISRNSARVLRGGSWSNNPVYLRVAARSGNTAASSNGYFGFRCARTP